MKSFINIITKGYAAWFLIAMLSGCKEQAFRSWDENKDKTLSQEEFNHGFSSGGYFAQWDTDRSGGLDADEFYGGTFSLLDATADGTLDRNEWQKFDNHFQNENAVPMNIADADADGRIDKEEFTRALDGSGVHASWDNDGTGQLSPEEFMAGLFRTWDSDGNERIDDAEYATWEGNLATWQTVRLENLLPDVEEK